MIGDLFPHHLAPLMVAMNLPMTGELGWPKRVSSGGGLYVQKYVDIGPLLRPDKQKKERDYLAKYHPGQTQVLDREIPDFVNMSVDFDGCSLMMMASSVNEDGWPTTLRMNKATINFGSSKITVKPDRVWSDDVDPITRRSRGRG